MSAILDVGAPIAGQPHAIALDSGQSLRFLFSLTDAVITFSGKDMVITMPDGGVIVLEGATDLATRECHMHFGDGARILLDDLIDQVHGEGGTYRMPEIVEGLSRLGDQGTDQFGRDTEHGEDALDGLPEWADDARQGESPGVLFSQGSNLMSSSGIHITPHDTSPGTIAGNILPGVSRYTPDTNIQPGDAAFGEDYTGTGRIRIEAGATSGGLTITVNNDNRSEGDEAFRLSLTPTVETAGAATDILGRLDDVSGVYGSAKITIQDDGSGPEISWNISPGSVPENGSLTLTWESRHQGGRQIVDEDVDLVFEITPGADFTLSEIKSITFGGNTYTHGNANPALRLENILAEDPPSSGKWLLTLEDGLPAGTGLNQLTIVLENDVISDGDESFSIRLKGVEGGETSPAAGAETPVTVTVTETVDGPYVDLAAKSGDETDLTVVYELKLAGGSPTGESSTVELVLSDEARQLLDTGKIVTISGGPTCSYANGVLTVTLPPGAAGGATYTVTFPIKDNAVLAEKQFGLSLGDLDGGELRKAAEIQYKSEFIEEISPDGSHGGIRTFEVSTTDSLSNSQGKLSFDITGLANKGVVQEVRLGDKALTEGTEPGQWRWNDVTNRVEVITEPGPMKATYEVSVVYNKNAPAEDLSSSKLNTKISNPQTAGREVTITVGNEANVADRDGPKASLALTDTTVDEGAPAAGILKVSLNHGPDDTDKTLDVITVTIKVEPTNALFALDDPSYLVSYTNGVATVTIPKDTLIPNGGFELGYTVTTPDNSTAGNGSYELKITGMTQGTVYENYTVDPAPVTLTVTDETNLANRDGPKASLTLDQVAVEEGTAVNGTLLVTLNQSATEGGKTLDAITVTLTIQPGGADFTLANPAYLVGYDKDTGVATVTIPKNTTIPNGGFSLGYTVTPPDNSTKGPLDYELTLDMVQGTVYENYTVITPPLTLTATDEANEANLDGPRASLTLDQVTVEEGAAATGKLLVTLNQSAAEGGDTLDAIIVTLTVQPGGADFALTDPAYQLSYNKVTGVAVITIPKDLAIPGGGFAIEYTVTPPDNSTAGDVNYTLAITGMDDSGGVYENYTVDSTPVTLKATDEANLADRDGPKASLTLDQVAVEEGTAVNGTLLVTLNQSAAEENKTLDEITVTLTIQPGGADFALADSAYLVNYDKGTGVAVITIPADTPIPGRGFSLGYTVTPPDDCTNGPVDYTLALAMDQGTVYENYIADPAPVTLTATDEATPAGKDGPTVSLVNPGGTSVPGGGTLPLNLVVDRWSGGTETTLLEDIQVRLTFTGTDSATILVGGTPIATVANGEDFTVTIPLGTDISGGSLDFPFEIRPNGSSGGSFSVALDGVTGLGGGTQTYEAINLGAANDSGGIGILSARFSFSFEGDDAEHFALLAQDPAPVESAALWGDPGIAEENALPGVAEMPPAPAGDGDVGREAEAIGVGDEDALGVDFAVLSVEGEDDGLFLAETPVAPHLLPGELAETLAPMPEAAPETPPSGGDTRGDGGGEAVAPALSDLLDGGQDPLDSLLAALPGEDQAERGAAPQPESYIPADMPVACEEADALAQQLILLNSLFG